MSSTIQRSGKARSIPTTWRYKEALDTIEEEGIQALIGLPTDTP
jgi:hypothetical protein